VRHSLPRYELYPSQTRTHVLSSRTSEAGWNFHPLATSLDPPKKGESLGAYLVEALDRGVGDILVVDSQRRDFDRLHRPVFILDWNPNIDLLSRYTLHEVSRSLPLSLNLILLSLGVAPQVRKWKAANVFLPRELLGWGLGRTLDPTP